MVFEGISYSLGVVYCGKQHQASVFHGLHPKNPYFHNSGLQCFYSETNCLRLDRWIIEASGFIRKSARMIGMIVYRYVYNKMLKGSNVLEVLFSLYYPLLCDRQLDRLSDAHINMI